MAAVDQAMIDDEQHLLADGEGEQPAADRRLKPKLLVLGAGVFCAALYAATQGAGRTPAAMQATDSMAVQGLAEEKKERKKLLIESDLGDLVTQDGAPPLTAVLTGAGGKTDKLVDAAGNLFEHVVESSGLKHELADAEKAAFKKRFVTSLEDAKGAGMYWVPEYVKTAKVHLDRTKPVMTAALAKAVNEAQDSYTVEMKDWMVDESKETYSARLGRTAFKPEGDVLDRMSEGNFGEKGGAREVLPPSFDSRDKWPKCKDVIGRIHNQGSCGDCWVFGAMGPLDSRLCIHTDGGFSGDDAWLSRGFGASCAVNYDGCQGGWEYYIYQYVEKSKGLVTEGCDPYFAGENYADHWNHAMPAPACPTSCASSYSRSIDEEYFRPLGVQGYRLVQKPDEKGIEDMKTAMYEGGPVAMGIYAQSTFMGYSGGIFNDDCGQNANHAVHAIGWGEGFILGQNSWGPDWGLGGRFKVAHCIPTDFTVPGEITVDTYPVLLPK